MFKTIQATIIGLINGKCFKMAWNEFRYKYFVEANIQIVFYHTYTYIKSVAENP